MNVQPGVPIHIALENSVPIKHAGVPVEGHVVEPVYVFDHLVIPAGCKVLGHVTQVGELSHKQSDLTIATATPAALCGQGKRNLFSLKTDPARR